jgi:hypothetical protein
MTPQDTQDLAPGTRVTTRLYGYSTPIPCTVVKKLHALTGKAVYRVMNERTGGEIVIDASELEVVKGE